MEYKNFFETQQEAHARLNGTVVMYDGEPVHIIAITDHAGDGVLRAYVRKIGYTQAEFNQLPMPNQIHNFPVGHSGIGQYLDQFIVDNPSCRIARKRMDSPKFNKFRPYDLGMYWDPPYIYYVERQPNRKMEQGLIQSMLVTTRLSAEEQKNQSAENFVDMYGPEMRRCIMGEHPSPTRCLEAMTDPKYANTAAAFHRNFALVKGPIDTLFLGYKDRVIGQLPHGDFSKVRLGSDFSYCKEAVDELQLFNTISLQ
jgi:hypothetical protein